MFAESPLWRGDGSDTEPSGQPSLRSTGSSRRSSLDTPDGLYDRADDEITWCSTDACVNETSVYQPRLRCDVPKLSLPLFGNIRSEPSIRLAQVQKILSEQEDNLGSIYEEKVSAENTVKQLRAQIALLEKDIKTKNSEICLAASTVAEVEQRLATREGIIQTLVSTRTEEKRSLEQDLKSTKLDLQLQKSSSRSHRRNAEMEWAKTLNKLKHESADDISKERTISKNLQIALKQIQKQLIWARSENKALKRERADESTNTNSLFEDALPMFPEHDEAPDITRGNTGGCLKTDNQPSLGALLQRARSEELEEKCIAQESEIERLERELEAARQHANEKPSEVELDEPVPSSMVVPYQCPPPMNLSASSVVPFSNDESWSSYCQPMLSVRTKGTDRPKGCGALFLDFLGFLASSWTPT